MPTSGHLIDGNEISSTLMFMGNADDVNLGELYYQALGAENEKISDNVQNYEFMLMSNSQSVLYLDKDNVLYYKQQGKEKYVAFATDENTSISLFIDWQKPEILISHIKRFIIRLIIVAHKLQNIIILVIKVYMIIKFPLMVALYGLKLVLIIVDIFRYVNEVCDVESFNIINYNNIALDGCNNASKKTYYEISKSEVVDTLPTPKSIAKPSTPPSINASVSPSPTPKSVIKEDDDGDYPNPMNLLNSYAYALIDSINTGIFSTVEEYLLKDSNLYKMQKKLVYNLYDKSTTENLLSIEKIDEKWENKEKCLVTTKEMVEIFYASGKSETNTYYWTYTMVYYNNKYYLSDIVRYNK